MGRRGLYRRRYNSVDKLNCLKYNRELIQDEFNKFGFVQFNEDNACKYAESHADFTILFIIREWKSDFISIYDRDKLIDEVEGYYFACEEKMIDPKSFCMKINKEIIETWLNQKNFNYVGVYIGEYNDLYKRKVPN